MVTAKNGDTVRVHYRGYFDDGTEFDSSYGKEPFEFTLGAEMVIPGFENAVIGMAEGETKTVHVEPDAAYGERRDDLVVQVERNQIPEHIQLEEGVVLQVSMDDGSITHVTVTEIGDEYVTLDGNHPLAGKPINFEIQLVEIVSESL